MMKGKLKGQNWSHVSMTIRC